MKRSASSLEETHQGIYPIARAENEVEVEARWRVIRWLCSTHVYLHSPIFNSASPGISTTDGESHSLFMC